MDTTKDFINDDDVNITLHTKERQRERLNDDNDNKRIVDNLAFYINFICTRADKLFLIYIFKPLENNFSICVENCVCCTSVMMPPPPPPFPGKKEFFKLLITRKERRRGRGGNILQIPTSKEAAAAAAAAAAAGRGRAIIIHKVFLKVQNHCLPLSTVELRYCSLKVKFPH